MKQINYNRSADLSLEARFWHEEHAESPCSMGALIQLGKSRVPQEFRLVDLPESVHNFRGFFISAVTTTTDSLLNSAGCGEKIGFRLPLGLASQRWLSDCTTFSGKAAKLPGLRNELTRHAHLVLAVQSKDGEGRHSLFLLPL